MARYATRKRGHEARVETIHRRIVRQDKAGRPLDVEALAKALGTVSR